MHDLLSSAAVRPTGTVSATGGSEVFRNVVVEAGKSASRDSDMDYSYAGSVAVTILCSVCTSTATSLGSSGLILQARWLVLNADSYVTTENMASTAFLYWDVGAAMFTVYGPQFRLTLQNKGSQTVTLPQVTIFRRSQ